MIIETIPDYNLDPVWCCDHNDKCGCAHCHYSHEHDWEELGELECIYCEQEREEALKCIL